ncbi:hypothetical protein [Microvirga splendida]|uniref:Uncharacterized protein n=1 Tax=Microvirga splendida TaxID=2795727 RepID=A0ABS0Y542_9HYPH|nr:hypothetical protein [Microvirga splendida]MBJ6127437.1 hypothetical protein [Microvirga splendida]
MSATTKRSGVRSVVAPPRPERPAHHVQGAADQVGETLAAHRKRDIDGFISPAPESLDEPQDRACAARRARSTDPASNPPSHAAAWVLLVEGYNEMAVAQDFATLTRQSGAGPAIAGDLYLLGHVGQREEAGPT